MTKQRTVLDFYTQPAVMTAAGRHESAFVQLPRELAGLARVVQGLLLHEHLASAYGVVLSDKRRSESQLRSLEAVLDRVSAASKQALFTARSLDERVIGVCRHFSVLLVAMLRNQGIPARARCGFGAYFEPGRFIDHWVCEYWNDAQKRWMLVDSQIDELQQAKFTIDFDLLDVPRDRFIIAGDAWAQCRAGKADPSKFGIMHMYGLWFIAGNVLRDFAALNNMEMLPWDVWGAMTVPDQQPDAAQSALFDRLAVLTLAPDESFDELRRLYSKDDRLTVPAVVFNAVLNRQDTV